MATATTTQDDDLLIISDDDTSTETSDTIEFSFDDQDTREGTVQSEEIIEASSEGGKSSVLETENFSFDLTENTSNEEETQMEEKQTEELVEEKVDLGFGDLSISEEPSKDQEDISSVESTGSMNDILAKTIAELTARKDVIIGEKSSKSDDIASLKKQIKELQDQVKQFEAESAMLDGESTKITANITKLEDMRLDPVKDHNAKRVAKK